MARGRFTYGRGRADSLSFTVRDKGTGSGHADSKFSESQIVGILKEAAD